MHVSMTEVGIRGDGDGDDGNGTTFGDNNDEEVELMLSQLRWSSVVSMVRYTAMISNTVSRLLINVRDMQ